MRIFGRRQRPQSSAAASRRRPGRHRRETATLPSVLGSSAIRRNRRNNSSSCAAKGAEPDQAMTSVNANAHDDRACGVAAIAYIRDQTVDTMKLDNKLVQIVRISVFAGFNGNAWQRVSGMVQYAVLEGDGESI